MQVRNNNINLFKITNDYITQNKKKAMQFKIGKEVGNKKDSGNHNFAKEIIDQKTQMNKILEKTKTEDLKRKMQLSEEKNDCIKNIKELTKDFQPLFKDYKGMSMSLDAILGGNVDTVTGTMSVGDVYKNIGNLEYSIVHGQDAALAKYYKEGADQHETFAQYMGDNSELNIKDILNSKSTPDIVKAKVEALECLKTAYGSLYNIMDKIKSFAEESVKRMEELQKNMQNNINFLSKEETIGGTNK